MDIEREQYYAYKASEHYKALLKNTTNKPVTSTKQKRNYPCSCGSGIKFKKCCGKPDNRPICPVCNEKHTNVQVREDPYGKLFNQPLKGTYCNQCYDMLELNAKSIQGEDNEQ